MYKSFSLDIKKKYLNHFNKSKMNIENSNREAIVNQAVDYLLQIGFFKSKFCNHNKKQCVNVKCVIKRRKRTANAVSSMINWRCPRCQTYYSLNEGK